MHQKYLSNIYFGKFVIYFVQSSFRYLRSFVQSERDLLNKLVLELEELEMTAAGYVCQ
jgi:hypothetical protein